MYLPSTKIVLGGAWSVETSILFNSLKMSVSKSWRVVRCFWDNEQLIFLVLAALSKRGKWVEWIVFYLLMMKPVS